MQSGLTYYKLKTNLYGGDTTNGCSLTGGEIDNNFNFLRSMDIVGGYYDETGLHLKNVGDDSIDIPFDGLAFSGTSFDFSGSSYDAENGILDLYVNGEYFPISGFSVCDGENLWNAVSGLSSDLQCLSENVDFQLSALTEDFQSFKDSLENITVSGSSVDIVGAVLELRKTVEDHSKGISNLEEDVEVHSIQIGKLQSSAKTLNDEIKDINNQLNQDKQETNKRFNDISDKIDEEKERATVAENALDTKINNVSIDISNNVKTTLAEQQKDINNINDIVKETMSFAKSALTSVQEHKIDDLILKEDNLCLRYTQNTHDTPGVDLSKYNIYGDGKTIKKDGQTLSVITDKTDGVVSYKLFEEHLNDYNTLLSNYKALKAELDELKNVKKYYMAVISDEIVDIEQNINIDYILQHQFIIDINKQTQQGTVISTNGSYLMVAVPKDTKFKVTDEQNISYDADLANVGTGINYENIVYDIYSTSNGSLVAGTKYTLKLI